MKRGWMIAKWGWDETTKLGQHLRYQSWDSLDEYRLKRKITVKKMSFQLFKKKSGWKIRDRYEFNVGEEVTWWATWRRSDGRLLHKTTYRTQIQKDLFAIERRRRPSRTMQREWKKRAYGKKFEKFCRLYMIFTLYFRSVETLGLYCQCYLLHLFLMGRRRFRRYFEEGKAYWCWTQI